MFGSKAASRANKKPAVDESKVAAINQLFNRYSDPEDVDTICVDEIVGQLCEDLEVDGGSDVRVIVLLWKLGAARKNPDKPMTILRDTFKDRMLTLSASTLSHLKGMLPSFDTGFLDFDEFYDFYAFSFDLNREVPRKTLLRETVVDLLPIVLTKDRAPHLDYFLEFLTSHSWIKDITLDQWKTFLKFNQHVDIECAGYSADEGAWPLLFDDYVEWRSAKK